jgi:diguanylate cyclase (GGDEF)-like protein
MKNKKLWLYLLGIALVLYVASQVDNGLYVTLVKTVGIALFTTIIIVSLTVNEAYVKDNIRVFGLLMTVPLLLRLYDATINVRLSSVYIEYAYVIYLIEALYLVLYFLMYRKHSLKGFVWEFLITAMVTIALYYVVDSSGALGQLNVLTIQRLIGIQGIVFVAITFGILHLDRFKTEAVVKQSLYLYFFFKVLLFLGLIVFVSSSSGILFVVLDLISLIYLLHFTHKNVFVDSVSYLEEQKEALELEIDQLIRIDSLTGLLNRTAVMENIDKAFRFAAREEHDISVLLIDIDDFRFYNEVFGTKHGDSILKRVASIVKNSAMRPLDVAGRYSGDTFAVCLPNTDFKGADVVANRLMDEVHKLHIKHYNEDKDYASVSIAYTTAQVSKTLKYQVILGQTEETLRLIKETKKGSIKGLEKKENEE